MRAAGIVIEGSVPPRLAGGESGALSAMIAATAPAFCRFFTLMTKLHVPRSTSAILPAIAKAFVIGLQASVVLGPAVSAASSATAMSADTPVDVNGAPKAAAPTSYDPSMAGGALMLSTGNPRASRDGTAVVT